MSEIQRAVRVEELYPPGVVAFETATCRALVERLFSIERQHIERCVPKRAREFAAGRVCARAGLQMLGIAPEPLLPSADRMPRWPSGTVGSITHTDDYCLAVVGKQSQFAAVGVDAECIDQVSPSLWRLTMRPEELARVQDLPEGAGQEMGAIIYSAKEAFYKCQYALTRSWLGFEDVSVEIVADAFEISVVKPACPMHSVLSPWIGRFRVEQGRVITGIAAKHDSVSQVAEAASPQHCAAES